MFYTIKGEMTTKDNLFIYIIHIISHYFSKFWLVRSYAKPQRAAFS